MKKVLVICDDRWHPAEVIERGFAAFPQGDYVYDFVKTAKDILTPEMLREYDAVMICKSNQINAANTEPWFEESVTEVTPKEFAEYVREGGRLVVLHAGTAVNGEFVRKEERFQSLNQQYIQMIGCEFTGHPLRCPVTYKVTDAEHPLTQGVADFTERDEHYQLHFFADDAEVVMESTSAAGETMPAAWVRRMGRGSLVVIIPGHTLAVWRNQSFQRLVLNALGM